MTLILAGDIGGTKTSLRLVQAHRVANTFQQQILAEHTYPSQSFSDLVPMVQQFLTEGVTADDLRTPERACFGIAGPVVNQESNLTNLKWLLTSTRLEQELDIPQVKLINDFVATGYGIPALNEHDRYPLQEGSLNPQAPIAVIGAGTGLGQGFLLPRPQGGYQVFASEGGHADFAPRSEQDFQLLTYLLLHLPEQGLAPRVSVERVVSGQGIAWIYSFLRLQPGANESATLSANFARWQMDKRFDLAEVISQAAQNEQDPLCQSTMNLFVSAYGAEAGNLALKLLPDGGLYIAGGIAAKILPLLQTGLFMTALLDKGRLSDRLRQIPVRVVLNPKVGLIGAVVCALEENS